MELYCPPGISCLVPQDHFFGVLPHIKNPLLTKVVQSRWLDIGQVYFFNPYVWCEVAKKDGTKKSVAVWSPYNLTIV